jgi:RNA 2',3'-cyclic 3'-phosphodiesterase
LLLWAGAEDEKGELSALALKLENQFAGIGVKKEKRPFHPHITTARLKKKIKNNNRHTPAKHYLGKNRGADFGSMVVKRVSLIQSILTSEGAFYSEVSRYYIKKNTSG